MDRFVVGFISCICVLSLNYAVPKQETIQEK